MLSDAPRPSANLRRAVNEVVAAEGETGTVSHIVRTPTTSTTSAATPITQIGACAH